MKTVNVQTLDDRDLDVTNAAFLYDVNGEDNVFYPIEVKEDGKLVVHVRKDDEKSFEKIKEFGILHAGEVRKVEPEKEKKKVPKISFTVKGEE